MWIPYYASGIVLDPNTWWQHLVHPRSLRRDRDRKRDTKSDRYILSTCLLFYLSSQENELKKKIPDMFTFVLVLIFKSTLIALHVLENLTFTKLNFQPWRIREYWLANSRNTLVGRIILSDEVGTAEWGDLYALVTPTLSLTTVCTYLIFVVSTSHELFYYIPTTHLWGMCYSVLLHIMPK